MAGVKTQPTGQSVTRFLDAISDPKKRADADALLKLMGRVTGKQAKMWGASIVGFGSYQTDAGGEWPLTGFSPRSQNFSIYIMPGFSKYGSLLSKLGKHKTGKSCLYVKRLEDVDTTVLGELIDRSVKQMLKAHG